MATPPPIAAHPGYRRLECEQPRILRIDRTSATGIVPRPDGKDGSLSGEAPSGFVVASDGVRLAYRRWSSIQSDPWAVVVFLHGIASHGGWFGETATDLQTAGVAVYAPDRRGSGLSGGRRGHLATYLRGLDDVEQVMRMVADEHPGTPLFLAASSWAAKLGVVYAAERPAMLSGLLFLGPGLLPRINLSLGRRIAVVVGHLVAPHALISIPLTPEMYTANDHYIDLIRGDRMRLTEATTRFFWETARLDRLRRRSSARLQLPILVLQGDSDAMMDVPKTRRWFSQLTVEDKTYRAYPGAGHTLDFEPDRGPYEADILSWLSSRAPRPPVEPTDTGP